MTMYFPLVVHGAMLIEPNETESKAALDQFIGALRSVAARAKAGDESLKTAPHLAPRRRLDWKNDGQGKGITVRVILGGLPIIDTKKPTNNSNNNPFQPSI